MKRMKGNEHENTHTYSIGLRYIKYIVVCMAETQKRMHLDRYMLSAQWIIKRCKKRRTNISLCDIQRPEHLLDLSTFSEHCIALLFICVILWYDITIVCKTKTVLPKQQNINSDWNQQERRRRVFNSFPPLLWSHFIMHVKHRLHSLTHHISMQSNWNKLQIFFAYLMWIINGIKGSRMIYGWRWYYVRFLHFFG